jgi:hypothetical protein
MRPVIEFRSYLRAAASAAALAVTACTSMPELNEVKVLPEMRSFLPSNSNTYLNATAMRSLKPTGPEDLVDGQGMCAGAPAAAEATPAAADGQLQMARPVTLEMTECELARALGAPAGAEVGANENGQRSVVMTYTSGDRPGIYRFTGGRLVSIERGAEPEKPAKPEKKPKKAAPAKKSTRPTT